MTIVNAYDISKTPYLTTRSAAEKIVKNSPADAVFDFEKINFVSAAFADEFLRKYDENKIIKASKNISRIFRAVENRSH